MKRVEDGATKDEELTSGNFKEAEKLWLIKDNPVFAIS